MGIFLTDWVPDEIDQGDRLRCLPGCLTEYGMVIVCVAWMSDSKYDGISYGDLFYGDA